VNTVNTTNGTHLLCDYPCDYHLSVIHSVAGTTCAWKMITKYCFCSVLLLLARGKTFYRTIFVLVNHEN